MKTTNLKIIDNAKFEKFSRFKFREIAARLQSFKNYRIQSQSIEFLIFFLKFPFLKAATTIILYKRTHWEEVIFLCC